MTEGASGVGLSTLIYAVGERRTDSTRALCLRGIVDETDAGVRVAAFTAGSEHVRHPGFADALIKLAFGGRGEGSANARTLLTYYASDPYTKWLMEAGKPKK